MIDQSLTQLFQSTRTISFFESKIFCTCYCICIFEYDFYVKNANYAFNQTHSKTFLRFLIETLLQMLFYNV